MNSITLSTSLRRRQSSTARKGWVYKKHTLLKLFYQNNGNISSSAMSVGQFANSYIFGGTTLLYNYSYDQLNRLTGMDVANNFDPDSNSWHHLDTLRQLNERVTYDPNGNIFKYRRVADDYYGNPMDSLGYHYYPGTNRLSYISDSVPPGSVGNYIDLNNQTYHSNYGYDSIGNLISDSSEGISNIKWSVYGKILEITHTPNSKGLSVSI